ncbi:BON domain-containing protein [Variovorax soli]|uniref:Osmotically-inducible protein OsmY n=1 Tax=Variovorax soli TaxID=376815 RepID=A0ABU1NJG7_9BURK|nr:BON domain-containing protein [Variovorax soli]MDR6538140.1 osmotically-inducible protein OsmY [Variovorax soli]
MNPDVELRHEIFEALNWDPIACTASIDVRVEGGVVTLTGELADAAQKAAVECAVRRVSAAADFIDKLHVRAGGEGRVAPAKNSASDLRP